MGEGADVGFNVVGVGSVDYIGRLGRTVAGAFRREYRQKG